MQAARSPIAPRGADVVVLVRAQPGARRSKVIGLHGGELKIAVAAPALDDRANEALCALVAELVGVRPGAVELLSGRSSRSKRLVVRSTGVEAVSEALLGR
jgi:uncharacterized protein (TIGR00251 family)